MPGSFQGTRTIGVTGWPFMAWKHCTIERSSCTPCCMSTVTLSKPHCAITSAEKPDGIASQAFTTALPEAQTFLTLFAIGRVFPVFVSWNAPALADGPLNAHFADAHFARGVHYRRPGVVRQGDAAFGAFGARFPLRIARNQH